MKKTKPLSDIDSKSKYGTIKQRNALIATVQIYR